MTSSRRPRDVVVSCRNSGHRVRLAGGRRLMARARCPTCRSVVDPTRSLRLVAWVTNLRYPASPRFTDVAVWMLAVSALFMSTLTAALFWGLADVWWPATLLLFGPRWVLLVPLGPIIVVAAVRDRALLLPLGAAAWVILGPVMGFHTGWRSYFARADPAHDITLATSNIRADGFLAANLDALMSEWGADVAVFQECGDYDSSLALGQTDQWYTHADGKLCLVSRYPILDVRSMDRTVLASVGGSGLVASYRLEGHDGPFWVTNVHLATPREGFEQIRDGSVSEGIGALRQDAILREIEHRRAQRFVTNLGGPHIVAGDFNAPDESRRYRAEWSRWTNAFGVAGFGIGGTRLSGWIRARIDHILVDEEWSVVDARVGEDIGSDHLPMIATIRRR